MVITLTIEQFNVIKKLLPIAVDAISKSASSGEALSDSDKVEWNVSGNEVKFTIN